MINTFPIKYLTNITNDNKNKQTNQKTNINTILFIGEYKTGKSSIINRYIFNSFIEKYIPSDFHSYNRFSKIINNINYKFNIWESNNINYSINNIDIIVFVFDINKIDTIECLIKYITFIYSKNINPLKIYIIGNKTDSSSYLNNTINKNLKYIYSYINNIKNNYFNNIEFIETSALNNNNINYLFNSIINICINKNNINPCKVISTDDIESDTDDTNLCSKCICS